MPKTTLFETNDMIKPPYLRLKEDITNKYDYIKPGMVFTMNYAHTKDYKSEEAVTQVTGGGGVTVRVNLHHIIFLRHG
jgi:hypothetical protein